MTDYLRRIVSGNKTRFKDGNLKIDLDLAYITDQVIIMGFPASGIEGYYRNRREDAKRFLDHRHGNNYWSTFDGRVSRYPFPDHHAPPLAIMSLVAREMKVWLDGSPQRVAVLHCKAGKGRSGTMACAYLLSCDTSLSLPRLERRHFPQQWAEIRTEEMMNSIPEDEGSGKVTNEVIATASPASISTTSTTEAGPESYQTPLKQVLDLHTSRRMKAPSSNSGQAKQGVSIPSQRRFLYYWSLLLSHDAPSHLWATEPPYRRPKVRLTEIKIKMKELSNMRVTLVRAANAVLDRTYMSKSGIYGNPHVWASLARYDDDFVEMLERWERYTRMSGESGQVHMGKRQLGTDHFGKELLSEMFNDGRWDNKKMVRSFARLGAVGDQSVVKGETEENGKIKTYSLHPLSDTSWKDIKEDLKESRDESGIKPEDADIPASEVNSLFDITQSVKEKGVVLDAGREVRLKLYMGQVFMGWLWFIPAFHMPQPPPSLGGSQSQPSSLTTKLTLKRKEIDFALGVGGSIIDVEISLEWLKESEIEAVQPPARMDTSEEATIGDSAEPAGLAAALEAVAAGNVVEAVEAKQGAED
ncbi:hypothetical protein BDP27DRAFT_1383426 [Rhodocollybia butyracea]|uniref:phosphatidylinositol-3,4,5-trisphosphate 3-phosphatase n=1 Tax=Rhodocollybia butyracea TaxID=206335 RepID=A0A9P5PTF4_9AGAR|nr:hypothetical protein BDP27DRAFT_1383426 [Rhodocollybia butyracea]